MKKGRSEPKCSLLNKKYLSYDKKLLLVNSAVKSQYTYYPLIWRVCLDTLNNSSNNIPEPALCSVHNNYNSSFYDILEREKNIHQTILNISPKKYKIR